MLYERGENKDSAIYYLNKNLEDTKNIAGRGAALLSLYDIEKDLGNYKAASAYLEEHVEILDSMYSTEQYSELQQLINKYNIKIHIREEQNKRATSTPTHNRTLHFLLLTYYIILSIPY